MAVLALGAIGASIGGAIGGTFLGVTAAGWGWTIGTMVGQNLFGPKPPDGPRLGQQVFQNSSYGQMLPIFYGMDRGQDGNVIWTDEVREHATKVGGKGGPSSKQYSYTVSFAVAFCEGPIAGFSRVWVDGKLVFNISDSADFETAAAGAKNIAFYLGTETQMPDPTIEAKEGAGNVEAYRGTAYLVFKDQPYNGRVPQVSAEIIKDGGVPDYMAWNSYTDIAAPDEATDATPQAMVPFYSDDLGIWFYQTVNHSLLSTNEPFVTVEEIAIKILSPSGKVTTRRRFAGPFDICHSDSTDISTNINASYLCHQNNQKAGFALLMRPYDNGYQSHRGWIWIDASGFLTPLDDSPAYKWAVPEDQYDWYPHSFCAHALGDFWTYTKSNKTVLDPDWAVFYQGADITANITDYLPMTNRTSVGRVLLYPTTNYVYVAADTFVSTRFIRIYKLDAATGDYIGYIDSPSTAMPGGFLDDDTMLLRKASTNQIWKYSFDDEAWQTEYIRETGTYPALEDHGAYRALLSVYTDIAWHRRWIHALGDSAAMCWASVFSATNDAYASAHFYKRGFTAYPVAIGDIVAYLCSRAGLQVSEYDTSALVYEVAGYSITRDSSARGMIEPLLGLALSDAVESDGVLKFRLRNRTADITIDTDDLGAFAENTEPPAVMPLRRVQEVEVPAQVTVRFKDAARDYDVCTQTSPKRVTSSIVQDQLDVPVVITNTQAKYLADVKVWENLQERITAGPVSTTLALAKVEPTDIVDIDGETWRVTQRDEDTGGLITLNLVRTEQYVYDQPNLGVGVPAAGGQSVLTLPGVTTFEFLDIPLLRDADEGHIVYSAISNDSTNYAGAEIYRSLDGGGTYSSQYFSDTNAVVGRASTVLADWPQGTRLIDEGNTVEIVTDGTALASITFDQMLDFGNACVLGDEILCFRKATLTAPNTYTLSGLYRGLYGTEWAMDTHAAGERFVMLDEDTMRLIPQSAGLLNTSQLFKAVSVGNSIEVTPADEFTYTAACKKPYAPSGPVAFFNEDGDVVIRWRRRGRLNNIWHDAADVPLGEASEAYSIDLYWLDGTVAETLTSTTPELVLPYAKLVKYQGFKKLDLTNLDAETGASTGWTIESGTWTRYSAATLAIPGPHSGTYYFGPNSAATAEVRQRIDLTTIFSTAELDSGELSCNLAGWLAGTASGVTDSDQARLGIRYLDATQTEISITRTVADNYPATWTFVENEVDIPTGARFVDILMRGVQQAGATSTNAYFDDLEFRAYQTGATPTDLIRMDIYQISADVGRGFPLQASIQITGAT